MNTKTSFRRTALETRRVRAVSQRCGLEKWFTPMVLQISCFMRLANSGFPANMESALLRAGRGNALFNVGRWESDNKSGPAPQF